MLHAHAITAIHFIKPLDNIIYNHLAIFQNHQTWIYPNFQRRAPTLPFPIWISVNDITNLFLKSKMNLRPQCSFTERNCTCWFATISARDVRLESNVASSAASTLWLSFPRTPWATSAVGISWKKLDYTAYHWRAIQNIYYKMMSGHFTSSEATMGFESNAMTSSVAWFFLWLVLSTTRRGMSWRKNKNYRKMGVDQPTFFRAVATPDLQ